MSDGAFESLLTANLEAVRRFVRARMLQSDHADDVVQQTLLQAFAHRQQLRAPSKFKSWLLSIAVNEIRSFHRASRPFVMLSELAGAVVMDPMPSPFALCLEHQCAERLRAGMAVLSERDRTAIRLVDLQELTLVEAAGVLTMSTAALKSRHFRARQRLGAALRMAA